MSLLSIFQKITSPKKATATFQERQFEAVGVNYYLANVKKLACTNPDWKKRGNTLVKEGMAGKKIYRYSYINKPVKLIPEPKNPHDKNAVAVHIAGELVGYISREENQEAKAILASDVKYISAFISGGEYKTAGLDGDLFKGEYAIRVTIKIGFVG